MNDMMGVINTINEVDGLEELTYHRCIASVPFGARYRLIDFVLSSMVNSGISNVSVFTHRKYRSLMDHLGPGKEWDLDRKRSGLFVLPPSEMIREASRGDLQALADNRDYFYRSTENYVVISRSHMVCNLDFQSVLQAHKNKDADVTLVYKEMEEQDSQCRRIHLNARGRVTAMFDNGGPQCGSKVSMEMLLMKKELLLDLIDNSLARGYDHLMRDAIHKNLEKLKIYGYRYDGFLGIINTLQSYYKVSMNLLNPAVWRELFFVPGLLYTKIKDEPPSYFARDAETGNSLIANGCVIEGDVENCIVFRGVKIMDGAHVKNSIIMQNCTIRENVYLDQVILDKDVIINANRVLQGHTHSPFIAVKKKVI